MKGSRQWEQTGQRRKRRSYEGSAYRHRITEANCREGLRYYRIYYSRFGRSANLRLLRERFKLRLFPLRLAAFVAKTRVFRQLRATCAVLIHHFKCRMSSARVF